MDPDRLRAAGIILCKFVNVGCVCAEKKRPLCHNILAKAREIIEKA